MKQKKARILMIVMAVVMTFGTGGAWAKAT